MALGHQPGVVTDIWSCDSNWRVRTLENNLLFSATTFPVVYLFRWELFITLKHIFEIYDYQQSSLMLMKLPTGEGANVHGHECSRTHLLLIEWSWCLNIKVILNNNVLNLFFISVHLASEEIIESKAQEEEPSSLLKYFSVVWCKASKKKHKKWEGDAILIVKGRSFTLKDLEGKDIGRGIVVYYLSYGLFWN